MFEDLMIVDCSTVLAGPSVGTFFAELGASVIKIENPAIPDVTRSWKLASEDKNTTISAYFSSVNYRKQYRKLDFKNSSDLDELLKLVERADIFLSNFKKGDAGKFGLTDAFLHSINPRLIIGKISGFGTESDRVAYDLILQAETGFMSMNGTPESGPVKMPVALIDVLAAHQLKEGILTALLQRAKTNRGKTVSVSLYDAAICSLANQASNYLMENHTPERIGSLHPNIAPYGEIFITKDGKSITFAVGSNKHFELLCGFLGLSGLVSDERFATNVNRVANRTVLQKLIQERILHYNADEVTEYMHRKQVPAGCIQDLKEVFRNPESQKLIRTEQIESKDTRRVSQIAFQFES
ncbi:CaiB/BaiF CoA-transferase family protein [Fluviicola sp.]|jgi:crotonobetainyl-CoA:carnitine CoA-transferase CaiB-like acyl-CoA transferase|uniref:CaiB/BaiF CoA transferase family protein n=1 Tax=Fluviicola sp. TaxID=1917219 RepID=UPI0028387418|nr:CaiB/BaiF CoA-transferase family protein [Fluviicola sp.]MDR0801069.1 CoA transferase [Fluviicola sp.]